MFNDIVNFLAQKYQTQSERESLVIRAFYNYPIIQSKLNLVGTPRDVATHIVSTLQREDEIAPGMQALWHLLVTAREDFGANVQAQIDRFKPYANKEQGGSPSPTPGNSSPPSSPSSPNTPSSSSGPLPSTGGGPPLSNSSAGATGAGSTTGSKKSEWTAMQIAVVGAVIAGIFAIIAALITIFPPLLDRNEKLATQSALETQAAQTRAAQVSTASHTPEANTSTPQPTQITQLPTASNTPAFTPTRVSLTSIANPNLTNTSTPPTTSTGYPEQMALTPQNSNAAWKPVERDFDGVTMVLVPTGCFTMGSTDGDSDERPVQLMCFEKPFWMDKYEVSNAQYSAVGCEQSSSEPDQPRNCVTWFEARNFCATRDARLPTESEWEYAARGPDGLIYPWGNTWNENNLVWGGPFDFNGEIAAVGSRPTGASWVGAEDMSGNVWEWVSSLRQAYSPNMGQGREDENNTGDRVLRGGRFNGAVDVLRAANRNWGSPDERDEATGFRCARDI